MARQPDIQYVQFYTVGNAARKLEPIRRPAKNGAKLPQLKPRADKRQVLRVDPLSLCSVLVAAFMLVAMAIGMLQIGQLSAQADALEQYSTQLSAENAELRAEYRAGYDLKDVEQKALAMGLVPESQLKHVVVKVTVPPVEAEPTGWQEFCQFFTELFA